MLRDRSDRLENLILDDPPKEFDGAERKVSVYTVAVGERVVTANVVQTKREFYRMTCQDPPIEARGNWLDVFSNFNRLLLAWL